MGVETSDDTYTAFQDQNYYDYRTLVSQGILFVNIFPEWLKCDKPITIYWVWDVSGFNFHIFWIKDFWIQELRNKTLFYVFLNLLLDYFRHQSISFF